MIKLPKHVQIIEVGPRDGFQNIKQPIATGLKLEIIRVMLDAGVSAMEVTSFVHPKAIPQMADALAVCEAVADWDKPAAFRPIALVPNLTGAKKAAAAGIQEITYVISASEQHNLANINRTHEQSLADLAAIIQELPQVKVRLAAATSFGCPFKGTVSNEEVLQLVEAGVKLGVNTVILCDTIGVGNPLQVQQLSSLVLDKFAGIQFGLHLHDTRGMAMANSLAGLAAGITVFETSVGGLGGCPFAPGAAGNTATEDLVNMLHAMGVSTGIDLDAYLRGAQLVREKIQDVLTSRMAYACKYEHI